MPRRVGRPGPPAYSFLSPKYETEIHSFVFADLPPAFWWVMMDGLLFRLKKRNPQEEEWLRGRVPSLMSQFSVTKHRRGEREACLELLCWLGTARMPKSNTPKCDPVVLLAHHRIAREGLKGLERVLKLKGDAVVKVLKVEKAAAEVCENLSKFHYPCPCGGKPQLPSNVKAWLAKHSIGTVGRLVDDLLVECHADLSVASLRRLLSTGSRMVQPFHRWFQDRFRTVKSHP